ncbi:MAG: MBL fold metallo-hydrolase [Bdellovibrionota bacterium]|nr:MAG: MBL fold metallo-hydrolase [Bdellovibrionota bacterium]
MSDQSAASKLHVTLLVITPFSQNCRVLSLEGSDDAVVVDPGGEVERLSAHLTAARKRCVAIWLTHSHVDHCGGVKALKERTGAVFYGPRGEREMRQHLLEICELYGVPADGIDNCPEPDVPLSGGEEIRLGPAAFRVLPTPGHSPAHLCFYCEAQGLLIAGDTLFAGSIGRTDLPGADHRTLMHSIRTQLLTLPDDTRVLSGHGPDTTIGAERLQNPFLQGL